MTSTTADLHALLDALAAHPGGPKVPPRKLSMYGPEYDLWRDHHGVQWRWTGDRWRLDVADAATGGVLFDLLRRADPEGCWETTDEGSGRIGVLAGGFHRGLPRFDLIIAPTLGEAAARALAAVLGVAGGSDV